MTENKVKAIRAGIAIPKDELEPIEAVVQVCEKLLAEAKSGELRQLCFASVYNDESSGRSIVGDLSLVAVMDVQLRCLQSDHFDIFTYPSYSIHPEMIEE